jgi:hypothetical protein
MDSTVWTHLVRRYFRAAAQLLDPANLKAGSFQRDQAAIKAAAPQDRPVEERAMVLAEWLAYHRTGPAAADHRARQVLPVLDRLDAAELSSAFITLRAALARDDSSRSFMVLTSRLLWARFPEAAPVYDSATVNGIAFLVKLLKSVELPAPYERTVEERRYDDHDGYVHWDFNDKKLVDHWYYKDFIQSHAALYARCRPEIIRLIAEAGRAVSTASPFQVFDKMLWLIGDHRHDYSLKGSNL